MASTDALPIPQKGVAYRHVFAIQKSDGTLITGATGLDSEVSKDQGTAADCTNEATEIATSTGTYYLDLTSTEMNADCVSVVVKTTSTGAVIPHIVLFPAAAGEIIIDGHIRSASMATDTDVYQAKIWLFDDNAAGTPTDRYVVNWRKNGIVQTSGITSPTIQVVKVADGTDLIASTAMTQIASLGRYRYDATAGARVVSGVAYFAITTATIGGSTRTEDQPVGRDS